MEEVNTFVLRESDIEEYIRSGIITFDQGVEISHTCIYVKEYALIFRE